MAWSKLLKQAIENIPWNSEEPYRGMDTEEDERRWA